MLFAPPEDRATLESDPSTGCRTRHRNDPGEGQAMLPDLPGVFRCLCLCCIALNSSSHQSSPEIATPVGMSDTFPKPHIAFGSPGESLAEVLAQVVEQSPENILSPQPDVHPGWLTSLVPMFAAPRGSFGPMVSEQSVLSTELAPKAASGASRGLLWGVAVTLATVWVEHQVEKVCTDTDYQGQMMPSTAEQTLGRICVRAAKDCSKTSEDSATQPMPELLGNGRKPRTDEESKAEGDKVKRWRIFARSRAGKRKVIP